jgi:mRNA-degrading endonuclease RelE of RelBE toxin-antitoxin system
MLDALACGTKAGDQIPNVQYEVFKVRAKNSDASKGKSGGYRVIYCVRSDSEVVLITLYSKTEQADIAPKEIRRIILECEPAPEVPPEPKAGETD